MSGQDLSGDYTHRIIRRCQVTPTE
uniref:Uncharacterized protein n=1 Tax=Arundo donax TaxID=35708 RepID=A0A0A8ZN33_ARUDO